MGIITPQSRTTHTRRPAGSVSVLEGTYELSVAPLFTPGESGVSRPPRRLQPRMIQSALSPSFFTCPFLFFTSTVCFLMTFRGAAGQAAWKFPSQISQFPPRDYEPVSKKGTRRQIEGRKKASSTCRKRKGGEFLPLTIDRFSGIGEARRRTKSSIKGCEGGSSNYCTFLLSSTCLSSSYLLLLL